MPQLLRFEGSTPEEARTKARLALGDGVIIVRAGRERRGGVLGFFEQETYVLEVDADSGRPTAADSTRPAPAGSGPRPGAGSGPRPGAGSDGSPYSRHAADRLADGVADAFEIARAYGGAAAEPPAYAGADSGGADSGGPGAGVAPARVFDGELASSSQDFSQLLREAEATVAAASGDNRWVPPDHSQGEAPQPDRRDDAASTPLLPRARPAPSSGHEREVVPRREQPMAPEGQAVSSGRRAERVTTPQGAGPQGDGQHARAARRMLSELGLPDELLPDEDVPLELGLVDRLRHLPVAPALPEDPDSVVLVAGSAQHLGPLALARPPARRGLRGDRRRLGATARAAGVGRRGRLRT